MRRVLIIGFGDVARRAMPLLQARYRVYALARSPQRATEIRQAGGSPLAGDLDRVSSLMRLADIAQDILYLAPPPGEGDTDTRARNFIRALQAGSSLPQRLVYISTTGVYGDCGGAIVDETRRLLPLSARARRRVDAEQRLRRFGRQAGTEVCILRVPGIYAGDRLPLVRLRAGTPALQATEDVFTNHVHATDLARICLAALRRGRPGRVYNAGDGQWQRMGDYFDQVADHFGLARPPRVGRAQAEACLSEMQMSFLRESRRIDCSRQTRELRVRLHYPSVAATLASLDPR